LQRGDLVPDKTIVKLIEDWLHLHGGYGFVFDGFPRTLPQAKSLASILKTLKTSLDAAIWLDVSEETIRARISGRLQCRTCGFTTSVDSAEFADRQLQNAAFGRILWKDVDLAENQWKPGPRNGVCRYIATD
jgi:adenylate kinase family enzyme